MKITVLGAGAWGSALAASAAASGMHEVLLWARDAQQAQAIAATRVNARYLPEVALPPALNISADLDAVLAHCTQAPADAALLVIATPMAGLREMLARCAASLPAGHGLLWLCKGFEAGSGLLGHEIARDVAPGLRTGILSGPSFALEVARGQPTALVAASFDDRLPQQAIEAFHAETLRVYSSADPVGVEVGGAVKNVLAIATGICDGMSQADAAGPGLNARAALITRGLAEMTRLGLALGAREHTFMGLSGLGDLVLTATGALSRNRRVGLELAQGKPLAQVLAELGHVAEGVASAAVVLQRARALGVEMPITEAVVEVIEGRSRAAEALARLMRREARAEA
ncbi:NAD(P)H-dependent glycerol-3-phosphate dehydrogenase [Rivibacter subsaxonicus]|uniref:Glycerol-3-phosphate dehydrogenase [NAD(P)+] n=1 Tax=Rivibacter subsaxonicus TaxID=457575 RepID=A0A4Q7VZZ1_9BURK|nr:NAD(P)H-dependent glycerol-3-phosphate dehydrogenase [Rivibacter subsaxonicus]RZU02380.1 glycerol-3-phosphate dehydrogenase (NAD(P)+) [Rivibacter subsaxonicus]